MLRSIAAVLCAGALLSGCATPADRYFGHIQAPCAKDASQCEAIKAHAKSLGSCTLRPVGERCEAAEAILKAAFGKLYRRSLADFVVYYERDASGPYVEHLPVLMWEGLNTPHLYGVRHIYVLVLASEQVRIEPRITTDYQRETNPFSAIFSVLGVSAKDVEAKSPDTKPGEIEWIPLSGNHTSPILWLGISRLDVGVNTINRLNLRFSAAKTKDVTVTRSVKPNEESHTLQRVVANLPKCKNPAKDATEKCQVEASFAEADPIPSSTFTTVSGHFSNSPGSYAAFSIGLGVTFDTDDRAVTATGSDEHVNGYALAKLYAPWFRPRLRVDPEPWSLYRPSLGFVFGTNVGKDTFNELVLGVSIGHLVGNVGVTLGANLLPAGSTATEPGREAKPFVALDYTF